MLNVTSIDELLAMSQGELVELPPFTQGSKFIARMKRPSMMKLIKNEKIPNNLLRAANSLFTGKTDEEAEVDDEFLKDLLSVIDVLADAAFVEPSWGDMKANNIELTDEQYMFIFNYTQRGVSELDSFRENTENNTDNKHGTNVPL